MPAAPPPLFKKSLSRHLLLSGPNIYSNKYEVLPCLLFFPRMTLVQVQSKVSHKSHEICCCPRWFCLWDMESWWAVHFTALSSESRKNKKTKLHLCNKRLHCVSILHSPCGFAGSSVQRWNWQADRVQNQVSPVHAHSQQWRRDHWSCSGHQQVFEWSTLHWRWWKGKSMTAVVRINEDRSCGVACLACDE